MDSINISTEDDNDNDSKALINLEIQDTIKEPEDKPIDNTKDSNTNNIKIFHSLLKLSIVIICFYIILTEVPNSKQKIDENKINTSFNNRTIPTDIKDESKEKEKEKSKEKEKEKSTEKE